ncbi:hypothetical protein Rhe02_31150 [Rhizocola hellebori]|uniref:Uncharacterized protein n=1 Tax=Rhizocola hellebori TaxID=1392758 RepID=A0A8J3Q882_9ACTN|nr:hypothetical protein Rhe02_31150 [Rhizocola hellebori]
MAKGLLGTPESAWAAAGTYDAAHAANNTIITRANMSRMSTSLD